MPGGAGFAFPIQEKLRIDGHRDLFHSLGVAYIVGAAFVYWALTVTIKIPERLKPLPPVVDGDPKPFIVIMPPVKTAQAKPNPRPKRLKDAPKAAAPALARKVGKETGVLKVEVINSKSPKTNHTAFELIDKIINPDEDKLAGVSMLSRSAPTRVAEGRRGVQRDEYNDVYSIDDGKGRDILPALSDAPGPIQAVPKRPVSGRPDFSSSIEKASENMLRSSESIMAVIRAKSPGLRHLYNKYLKVVPGTAGKVTLRFAISPRGDVVDAALVSSSTDAPTFDRQVAQYVMTWRFEPVRGVGNDLVTVPFTFSE